MLKEKAVASLGQQSLLMPAWIKAGLAANDRLKLYLSVLQAAAHHARKPDAPVADWGRDLAQLGLHDARWLPEMVKSAYLEEQSLVFPQQPHLLDALSADLQVMARPVCEVGSDEADLAARCDFWMKRLQSMAGDEGLDSAELAALTHGDRRNGDSFHLLVMDLHKRLNALSGLIATENLDGAHVWQIADEDRSLISAFMRGLHRTAPLKFAHPGLDTAVTRDGARLLIQNDIGTNDVHVLVIEVEALSLSLTYSDLHTRRFAFFRRMLEEAGCRWTVSDPMVSEGLNAGKPYQLGRASFVAKNEAALRDVLEA